MEINGKLYWWTRTWNQPRKPSGLLYPSLVTKTGMPASAVSARISPS
jgi:hypothetical protein